MLKKFPKILVFLILAVFLVGGNAIALPILPGTSPETTDGQGTWEVDDTDAEGVIRRATADFSIDGASLMIVLTNTAPITSNPNQVLAGLFFDFSSTLGVPSVTVNSNSNLVTDSGGLFVIYNSYPYDDLNGEFGYDSGISSATGGRGDYGIVATSLDPLGFSKVIDPSQSTGPPPPGGADFGLVGDSPGANSSLGKVYVQSSVVIAWGIEESNTVVSNVHFIYGTDYYPIHEPATMLLLGSGLIGLGVFGRKKLFKK